MPNFVTKLLQNGSINIIDVYYIIIDKNSFYYKNAEIQQCCLCRSPALPQAVERTGAGVHARGAPGADDARRGARAQSGRPHPSLLLPAAARRPAQH